MFIIGPSSSVFDITTYVIMLCWICPAAVGQSPGMQWFDPSTFNNGLSPGQKTEFEMIFQGAWFIESMWTQTLVIHLLRTPKMPFVKSRASWPVIGLTSAGIAVGTILPFIPYVSDSLLDMKMPGGSLLLIFFAVLAVTILAYMALTTLLKRLYVKRYGELL